MDWATVSASAVTSCLLVACSTPRSPPTADHPASPKAQEGVSPLTSSSERERRSELDGPAERHADPSIQDAPPAAKAHEHHGERR